MESNAFYNYLVSIEKQKPQSANTRMRKCETIEAKEGNLDQAYEEDQPYHIFHLFDYSKEDMTENRAQKHHVPIGGSKGSRSIYEGTKDYQSSLGKYIEFKRHVSDNPGELQRLRGMRVEQQPLKKTLGAMAANDWPQWDGPSERERRRLAEIVTRYVRFLNPSIVEKIVRDNKIHRAKWEELLLECGTDPSEYLWDGSSCCFPGVRRHSGKKEISEFSRKTQDFENALALDDNRFPKQIWSYVFRNTGFSNYGPQGYQLAHLVDHKDVYGRLSTELVFSNSAEVTPIPGLFTSPVNTAYVPVDFLKPTDFESKLRSLLQRKARSLYSDVCSILPPGVSIAEEPDQDWSLDEFDWPDTVGTIDHVPEFLLFREKKMTELFEERLSRIDS